MAFVFEDTLQKETQGPARFVFEDEDERIEPVKAAEPVYDDIDLGEDFGKRADGTQKGPGFLGTLQRPDGKVSTEISIGTEFDDFKGEIPSLVPTLTQSEIDHLLSGGEMTDEIVAKAVDHARQRMTSGKSPFQESEDDIDLAKDIEPLPEADITGSPISAMADLIPDLAELPPEIREAHPFKLVETAVEFWDQYLMSPEEEQELQAKYPDAMAARYAGLDLLLPGVMGKVVSPTELEEFTKLSSKEQKEEILGLAASYTVFGAGMKSAQALIPAAIKRFPWLTKDVLKPLKEADWFRNATIKQRGLAVNNIDATVKGMVDMGMSDAEIMKTIQRHVKQGGTAEKLYEKYRHRKGVSPEELAARDLAREAVPPTEPPAKAAPPVEPIPKELVPEPPGRFVFEEPVIEPIKPLKPVKPTPTEAVEPTIEVERKAEVAPKIEKKPTPSPEVTGVFTEGEGVAPLKKIGDSVTVSGIDSILAKTERIDGVDYELYNGRLKDKRGTVRVFDSESGGLVQINTYPTYDQAETAYNDAVKTVKAPAIEPEAVKATFVGWQEDGKGGGKALYNIPEGDGQTTVTDTTLAERGIEVPETPPLPWEKAPKAEKIVGERPKKGIEGVKDFYTPGNIIWNSYWRIRDKVLDFKETESGWEVQVQTVDKDGKPEGEPRWHATAPDKADLVLSREPKVEKPAEAVEKAKEPWERTLKEEIADAKSRLGQVDKKWVETTHKQDVANAISQGKIESHPDYPELTKAEPKAEKPKKVLLKDVKKAEREYASAMTQYGEKNLATIRALGNWQDLQKAWENQKIKKGPPKIKESEVKVETRGAKKEVSVDIPKSEADALTPKEQKAYLIAEIDTAIDTALTKFGDGKELKPEDVEYIKEHPDSISLDNDLYTFHVPGDGKFEVLGGKLFQFKKNVKSIFPATFPKPFKTKKFGITKPKPRPKKEQNIYETILQREKPEDITVSEVDSLLKSAKIADVGPSGTGEGGIKYTGFINYLLEHDLNPEVTKKLRRSFLEKDFTVEIKQDRLKGQKEFLVDVTEDLERAKKEQKEIDALVKKFENRKGNIPDALKNIGFKTKKALFDAQNQKGNTFRRINNHVSDLKREIVELEQELSPKPKPKGVAAKIISEKGTVDISAAIEKIGKRRAEKKATAELIEKDRTFANRIHEDRDVAVHNIEVKTKDFQRVVQSLAGPKSRKMKFRPKPLSAEKEFKDSKVARDLDKAMTIYRDHKINPERYDEFRAWATEELKTAGGRKKIQLKEQLRTLIQAENLTPEQRAFVDTQIEKAFKETEKVAKANGIIQTGIENYTRRIWGFPEKGTPGYSSSARYGFKRFTTAKLPRTLETIADGWMKGFDLKVKGITNSYESIASEIATIAANQAFVKESMDMGMISTKEHPGFTKLEASGFSAWTRKAGVKIKTENDAALLEVDTHGRKIYFAPPKSKWAVYETEDATRAKKLFDYESDALEFAAENDYPPPKFTQRADVFEKVPLYAPERIADYINKMTRQGSGLFEAPAARMALRVNAGIKSWILLSSFYHHYAGARSWAFGVEHGYSPKGLLRMINPVGAHKRGLKKIQAMDSILQLGIKKGLTLFKVQDWNEGLMREQEAFIESIAKNLGMERTAKAIEWGKLKRERFTSSLFGRFFAGLKAEAYVTEFGNRMLKATKDGKIPNADLIAEQTARLMNADFGGLHLKRMGRHPDLQKAIQLVTLAPDWCSTGDTRAMTKRGWKYYYELVVGKDEILAFNPTTQQVEWSLLKDIYINKKYAGKLIQIKNYNRSIKMTPDHTCYVYNSTLKKYSIVKAKDLQTNHQIPRCALNGYGSPQNKLYSDIFIKLVGWFVTDGYTKRCTNKLSNGDYKNYYYGKITQSKPHTVALIKSICKMKYHTDKAAPGGVNKDGKRIIGKFPKYVFTIPKIHFKEMEKLGLCNGLNWEFLSKLTKHQLQLLYDTMHLADGTGQRRFCGKENEVFYMTMIQAMLGLPTTFYQQEKNCWRTRCITRSKNISCWGHHNNKSEIDYSGTIWCPSVETGFWLAEREGLMFITGNTESNFRTASGMMPGLNKFIADRIDDMPPPPGMEKVYRGFWGGILLKATISTILAGIAINGLYNTVDFWESQGVFHPFENWDQFKRLRWTGVDVTKLYKALGIKGEPGTREVFSIVGHFADPLKVIHPEKLAKGKASPLGRVAIAAGTKSDWRERPFVGTKEFLEKGRTIKKSRHQEKENFWNMMPALVANQFVSMQPIQLGYLIKYAQGEEDGLSAILKSSGLHVSKAYGRRPPKFHFKKIGSKKPLTLRKAYQIK